MSFGEPLSAAARLRKTSRLLRGIDPSAKEYRALQEAKEKNLVEPYFDEKLLEYMNSPGHIGKMTNRLEELFYLKTGARPPEKGPRTGINPSATEELFGRVIRENLSWDQLLLSKKYTLASGAQSSDRAFFQGVFEELGDAGDDILTIEGDPEDSRLAGVITTDRFARRFTNSTTNKNRRRAAAIFRIFLCDHMRPAVDIDQGEVSTLFDLAFDNKSGQSPVEAHQAADPHGKDPKCLACHYKLDPMGYFFSTMGTTLGPVPSRGRLTFKRKDSSLVDIPGKGLGELAKAIVSQPEYAECQVSHFWGWFMTSGTPMTSQVRAELVSEFNRVGRKPKEFISYLMKRREFREPAETHAEDMRFMTKISPLLRKCNECHMGLKGFPDFNQLPIGGSKEHHVGWLQRISRRLDLENNGQNRTMPPAWAGWDITKEQMSDMKSWLEHGAPDENRRSTISAEEAQVILRGKK